MLAVGFLGLLATGPGQSYNIAVFVNPLIEELKLSRTGICMLCGGKKLYSLNVLSQ